RRAGRHDVVDDQHPPTPCGRAGPEDRAVEALGPGQPGLRHVALTLEQTSARKPELQGDPASDHLSLIEAAPAPVTAAGRGPGHDVEVARSDAFAQQPVDEQPGEVVPERAPVAVLE